jgi:predicted DCC family thiol-disulfide oxidoreductase YuxK
MTAEDPSAGVRFPWISRESLEESIHLVALDGRTWEGAGAVEMLVGILPGWRWASFLFRLPLARPAARRIYRWVARNRYRLSCGDHCRG